MTPGLSVYVEVIAALVHLPFIASLIGWIVVMHITRDICLLAIIAVAAVSELDGQPSGARRIAGGTFEASGVVSVPGTNGALFVDDNQTRGIFWMELTADGDQKGAATRVAFPGVDVVDLEGMTTDGKYFYAVGSQSKNAGFHGDGLIRFTFDAGTKQIGRVESVRGLKRFLATHVPELHGADKRVGDEALNIEGLAWDPRESRLLLGLRAPVIGADAVVVPLKLRDGDAPFTSDNLAVDGKGAIKLPLQGAGLRSIEYDTVTGRFLLFTGAALNDETREFRLLEWNGTPGAPPREIARYPRTLKPEGISRIRLAGRDAMLVVFDIGSYEVIDRQ
jgi:hypothetical protein